MSILKACDVRMFCPSLSGAPRHAVSKPYSLRWFRDGDQTAWTRIVRSAEEHQTIEDNRFYSEFGADRKSVCERMCFVCTPGGEEVGTFTAWYGSGEYPASLGRPHWLAVAPAFQGKGLARPLISAVCERLRSLGHESAYLTTNTARVRAIRLYLEFGFLPEIKGHADSEAWQGLKPQGLPLCRAYDANRKLETGF